MSKDNYVLISYSHQMVILKYMRHGLLLFCLLFYNAVLLAQERESLLNQLASGDLETHDSLYYELFKISRIEDIKSAKRYALKSFQFANRFENWNFVSKASRAVAYTYTKEDNLDSASYYYHFGINIASKNSLDRVKMSLLIDLGVLYDKQDTYDSALRYYNLALEIANKIDAKDGIAAIQNNIGLVFFYLNNFDEALVYLKSALEIKRKHGFTDELPTNLMNIAVIYNDQGRFDDAINIFNEVNDLCKGECLPLIEARLNYGLGFSYNSKKEYNKAFPFLIRGYEIAKASNNKSELAYTQFTLSEFRLREGDYAGAIQLLNDSEMLASEINLKRLKRDIYNSLWKIYEELGNLEKVVEYQGKYMSLKDSIFNEQLASNLKDIQLDAQRKQSEVIIQQKDT